MPSVFADGITILYCSSPPPATKKRGNYYYCEAMQGRALPQALLIKGGFGWIVDMTEDISPPPATKTGETLLFLLL